MGTYVTLYHSILKLYCTLFLQIFYVVGFVLFVLELLMSLWVLKVIFPKTFCLSQCFMKQSSSACIFRLIFDVTVLLRRKRLHLPSIRTKVNTGCDSIFVPFTPMRKANGLVNFKFLFCNGYSLLYTSRYLTLQLANRVIFSSLTSRANYCVLVAVRRKCTITLGALGKQRSLGEKLPLVLSELPYDLGGINVNQVEVFRMFWIKVLRIYWSELH